MLSVFHKGILLALLGFCLLKAEANREQSDFSISKVLLWPLDNVVQPTFNFALLPVAMPIQYAFDRDVVSRTLDFFQIIPEEEIYLFPTSNVFLRQNSFFGAYLIYRNLLGFEGTRMTLHYKNHLDDDWSFKGSYGVNSVGGSPFSIDLEYSQSHVRDGGQGLLRDTPTYEEAKAEELEVVRSDTSWTLDFKLSQQLNSNSGFFYGAKYMNLDFRTPVEIQVDLPESQTLLDLRERGVYDLIRGVNFSSGWGYNSKNNSYATTSGQLHSFKFDYGYFPEHGDYMGFHSVQQGFFLIGDQPYELSREENKQKKKEWKKLKVKDAFEVLNPLELNRFLTSRKVLVFQMKWNQIWDVQEKPAVVAGFQKLGYETPLRAWSKRSYASYGNASFSLEYRWPIIRRLDGFIFNEYGTYFRAPWKMQGENWLNSWGLGFRIRSADAFYFRTHLAIHGTSGASINASISPVY